MRITEHFKRIKMGYLDELNPQQHEAVTNTLALLSSILLASSLEAKPPKTTECTAPILPQANIAITACGIIGI